MQLKLKLPAPPAMLRLLIALTLAMAGMILQPPTTGSAHAVLVKADPPPQSVLTKPPGKVTLWMSEPLNPRFSSIQVFDSQQQRVDLGNSSVAPDGPRRMEVGLRTLKEDIYTVLWTANSQLDGHTLRGTYNFTINLSASPVVSQVSPPPAGGLSTGTTINIWTPANVVHTVAQWILLLIALLIAGSLIFRVIVPRLLRIQGNAELGYMLVKRESVRWTVVERFLAVALPSSTIIVILATVASAGGGWGSAFSISFIRDYMAGTQVGIISLIKVILSLVVAAVLFIHLTKYVALIVSLLFLASVAFTGHARAVEQPLLVPVVLDWVHLVAASAWFGGMVFAAIGLLPAEISKKRLFTAWQQFVLVMDGFAPVAFTSVGLLLATGLYNSATRLSSTRDLLSSGFGLVLMMKLMAVGVMIVLGYLNTFVIRPRLKIAREKPAGDQITLVSRLRRVLVWEPIFGVIAVMVTAVLAAYPAPGLGLRSPTPLSPVASTQAQASVTVGETRLSLAQRAEDLMVILKVGPGDVGQNRMAVTLMEAVTGQQLRTAALVRLRATFLEQESGSQFITTEKQPDGTFAGNADFTFKGLWKIEVIIRRQNKADVIASFPLVIPTTDATALLARADKTMNGLKSLALHEELNDAAGPIQARDIEFQAPDRTHFRDQRGFEVYLTGTNQFFKERGGKWQRGTGLGRLAYAWSDFGFGQDWEQPVIAGTETIDGQPHSIVTAFDSQAGIHYLLWIGTDDNLIRRWQHIGPGHFLDFRFSGFNSTTVSVADSELPR